MLTVDFDRLGISPGVLVLDLGCGSGRHTAEAALRGARVVGLDRDAAPLRECVDRLSEVTPGTEARLVRADALRLPFADATFDVVIASEVLEHIPDDAAAAREIARVVRPGGAVGISVPRWFPEQVCWTLSDEYRHKPGGHVRIYTRVELERLLTSAGLAPTGFHHAHALHSPYWWLRCGFGVDREESPLPRLYHRLLHWQLMHRVTWLDRLESVLNPFLGKSVVVYASRPADSLEPRRHAA